MSPQRAELHKLAIVEALEERRLGVVLRERPGMRALFWVWIDKDPGFREACCAAIAARKARELKKRRRMESGGRG